jgi:hypothetical protein
MIISNRAAAFLALVTTLAACSFSPSARAEPADPSKPAFSRWPADAGYFPLAVWVQSPANAKRYKEIGINTYVALWRGPTDESLDALDAAGMYAVVQQNERSLKYKDRKTIIAWMHGDEPDNAQPLRDGRKGYGPPIATEKVVEDYKRLRAADPDRPVLLNLGQGVAFDNYIGRGVRRNHLEDYPQYVQGCDIASFDIYPVTHEHADVAGKLEYVGKGVARLRDWTGGQKPVWACIETTHIHNAEKLPTPAQVRSEVWMAIANGATGIIYFCHEFSPKSIEAGLLEHPEIADAVKQVNGEVRNLAAVLNSPTAADAASVSSSDPTVPVALLCKRHDGATYLFVVSMRGVPITASITLAGVKGNGNVEVIGENRNVSAFGGNFTDKFDGYGVHVYRMK